MVQNRIHFLLLAASIVGTSTPVEALLAQTAPPGVLVQTLDRGPDGRLPADEGLPGLWHALQKLRTTASVLYTAGHPDDEEAGVLTALSRGVGARTALLTLNRGEGGANAIGPELFDALGLIRTEELRLSGRYYGLDDQYYTTAIDYGYSKTLDEAMRSWDTDAVIGDMVRIIRMNRPLVVISRWHGSARDGHGHHQATGLLTPLAVEAAGDPSRYPEQITAEGLRPWRVPRLYRGRLLVDEPHHAEVDPHVYSPWLGRTFRRFGSYGLSLQRSQTQGRVRAGTPGPPARYERLVPGDPPPEVEASIFEGLDTSLSGAPALLGVGAAPVVVAALTDATDALGEALDAWDGIRPDVVVPGLTRYLVAVRRARQAGPHPDLDFLLAIKEEQASVALLRAAGVDVAATAVPEGAAPGTPLGPVSPGQTFDVVASVEHAGLVDVRVTELTPVVRGGVVVERVGGDGTGASGGPGRPATGDRLQASTFRVRLTDDARPTRPWFRRASPSDNRYTVLDSARIHLAVPDRPARVRAVLDIAGTAVERLVPVRTTESRAPMGSVERPFTILPAVSVAAGPASVVADGDGVAEVVVTVTGQLDASLEATVRLEGDGVRATPASRRLAVRGSGELASATFQVRLDGEGRASGPGLPLRLRASATVDGRTYTDEVRVIEHPDLEPRTLHVEAGVWHGGGPHAVAPGLRVGYVMGVGDDVPAAIRQLGATVTLVEADELRAGDLGAYDVLVIGTRAYAVREDLVAANDRVLDFARAGGHLVVLYQTQEYRPEEQAPFPASLPGNAEEVSEEDAPVTLLAPTHPLLTSPNPLGPADFDGWIEQRGSKFFASWSDAYTPLIETHDTGQAEQRGVWLSAPVGDGHFTWVALALHRQLPYGVPGAYRILANLLSLGR